MIVPEKNLYAKYGDPNRVVEFRAFSFNSCGAGCNHCYYEKSSNDFFDFSKALQLAKDFEKNNYTLETIYLLPTDIFENDFNLKVLKDPNFKNLKSLFNYVGLASTLRKGIDAKLFEAVLEEIGPCKLELHLNILESCIDDHKYLLQLKENVEFLKDNYGSSLVVNLALNIGANYSPASLEKLKYLVAEYSTDKILELNFTFLFNKKVSRQEKSKLLHSSYPILNFFSKEFEKTEKAFNSRTLLRKPSITFKKDKMFLSPIIPFDEYVFIDDKAYELENPSFDSFLATYQCVQAENVPPKSECESCDYFEYCLGKSFFSVTNFFKIPCIKECGGN